MSRIQSCFGSLGGAGRKALIPYVMAGDPEPSITVPLMHAMVKAGADVIELGVPFSDPMADGPVVQRAGERALKHGVGLADVIDMVARFRETDATTPVVLMGYANPVETMGVEAFVDKAVGAGVDGVIVVDYPPEECVPFATLAKSRGLDPIFLLAPTSTEKRIRDVANLGSGYLYYVSLKGVTGAASLDLDEVAARVPAIRAVSSLPVGVGFGIRDAASAQRVGRIADAVVIGSRIIQEMEAADGAADAIARVSAFLAPIRAALDAG